MKKRFKILIGILLLIGIGVSGCFAYHKAHASSFYNNTFINGVDVSDHTLSVAKKMIEDNIGSNTFKIVNGDETVQEISFSKDLSYTIDFGDSLEKLKSKDDAKNIYDEYFEEKKYTVNCINFDEKAFKKYLKNCDFTKEENTTKTEDATMVYNKETGKFEIQKEVYGTDFVIDDLMKTIEEKVCAGEYTLDLSSGKYYKQPAVLSEDEVLVKAVENANDYLDTKITYTFYNGNVTITEEEIADMISFDKDKGAVIDSSKVKTFVANLASKHDTQYKTRTFTSLGSGKTVKVSGGSYGYTIAQASEAKQLKKDIKNKKDVSRAPKWAHTGHGNSSSEFGNTYVECDLASQKVYLIVGGKCIYSSDCVSGNVSTGHTTPSGVYSITYKESPSVLNGTNDDGSTYASNVTYWMPFNGGIGLHDATWRSYFGGSIYKTNGSHGCVNLPTAAAGKIYANVSAGTCVVVHY